MSKRINATRYEEIPIFPDRDAKRACIVNAIIETPMNCPHKYALEAAYGIIAFHDVMPDGMRWPVDYGFVPRTLAEDGDPLDVVVMTHNGLFSGCLIRVRILGAMHLYKECVENDRLIAVPLPSAGVPAPGDTYRELSDIPANELGAVMNFLLEYSRRQGHRVEDRGRLGTAEAMRLVKRTAKAFRAAHKH